MLLNGTKRSYEVTGESSQLTEDIKKYLGNRKVSLMYRFKGAKVISDTTTCEIGNTHYREMIVKRGSEYACLCYIKGSSESPDVLVAYAKPEKYKKHV